MFGYVKPLKCELKIREWELYRAVYCGLCHALKRRCGFAARFTVNYDFTFLALVLSGIEYDALSFEEKRCIASPLKKRTVCKNNVALDYAADTSIILTYWKIMDEICDSGFFKGVAARIAAALLKPAYRRAEKKNRAFSEYVQNQLEELREIEKMKIASLDVPADVFANILKKIADVIDFERNRRILGDMFYHLGRYIYLIDAFDDLQSDLKSGSYNPIIERFEIKKIPVLSEISQEIKETIGYSIKSAVCAFELIDECKNAELIRNILTLGLPSTVELVEKGELNKKEKIINERSI